MFFEFSSCARSNCVVWCRFRPQESRCQISAFEQFWVNFRSNQGEVRSPRMVSRAISSILLRLKMFLRHPRGSRTSRNGCKWCFKGCPMLPLRLPKLPQIFFPQDLMQHPQILFLVDFFDWVCYKNFYLSFQDSQNPS